jgi:hypothetical protein
MRIARVSRGSIASMRWTYPAPDDAREAAARVKTERAMDAFFTALAEKSKDLDALFSGKKRWDLPAFMAKHLGAVDKKLMWEFGAALRGDGHRLAITAEAAASGRRADRARAGVAGLGVSQRAPARIIRLGRADGAGARRSFHAGRRCPRGGQ